ncbi:hypothetical protein BH11MYX2_BH11MYX2_37800 [soil metagenome]
MTPIVNDTSSMSEEAAPRLLRNVHQPATAIPWIIMAMVVFIVQVGLIELARAAVSVDVLVLSVGLAVISAGRRTPHARLGSHCHVIAERPGTELTCACVRARI